MSDEQPSREELLATITNLRLEIAKLRDEVRRLRRDENEAPPHYL